MCKRKMAEIAAEIDAILKRYEADKARNTIKWTDRNGVERTNNHFYCAGAHASGRFVYVTYVSYQGTTALTRERAERYLAWLKAGGYGSHWAGERDAEPEDSPESPEGAAK